MNRYYNMCTNLSLSYISYNITSDLYIKTAVFEIIINVAYMIYIKKIVFSVTRFGKTCRNQCGIYKETSFFRF